MNHNIRLFPIVVALFVIGIFSFIIGLAFDASWWASQKDVNEITKEFQVADFTEVVANNYASVEVIQGDKELLVASGNEKFINNASIEVSNHVLTIAQKNKQPFTLFSFGRNMKLSYKLYVKTLNRIDNRGVGNFEASSLKGNDITIVNKGVGSISFHSLDMNKVTVNLEGTGSVELGGKSDALVATLDGVGSLESQSLIVKDCTVTLRGIGSAEIYCKNTLDGHVYGVGGIEYDGNPSVSKEVRGIGTIEER